MRRQLLSAFLVFALCLSLFSVSAMATFDPMAPDFGIVDQPAPDDEVVIDKNITADQLRTSEEGIQFIMDRESFVSKPMSDYGQYSIGYGCSTEFAEKYGFSTTQLTKEEAYKLLLCVLAEMEVSLDNFMEDTGLTLNQYQYDALMSFTFNLGRTWMKDSRLSRLLVSGNYTVNEFASALGVYCHVKEDGVAKVLDLLVDRRIREIKLFLYGAYELSDVENKFCTLKFVGSGGGVETDIGFYEVGKDYQILFEAEPTAQTDTYFVGWYTADGEKITADDTVQDSTVVYARWSDYYEDPELTKPADRYVAPRTPALKDRTGNSGGSDGTYAEVSEIFSDMYQDKWYYTYINDLYNGGIIIGYEDGTFRPNRTVTTGEALKMIILAAGYAEPEEVASHWARGYLNLALDEGIIDRGEITDLDVPISRSLMAKVAANALGLERLNDFQPFYDTTSYYAGVLFDYGISEGYEDGSFGPNRSLTRAELSTIVWRINNMIG